MHPIPPKLFSFADACSVAQKLRNGGRRIVLTNGCFDIVHAGHVFALESAKKFGDSLWVAMNSDSSVRALKGNTRPIFGERARAYVLSALEAVDGIFIFDGKRLTDEILRFRPDVYVKSGDYSIDTLDTTELRALRTAAVQIQFVPFVSGFSTTAIVEKL
ncbi:MAG: adenylyltransferase/cytidyltransferase family protein [Puniceicoccales bacterium]|jgi:D-beta-D-heptose 7-phosphate kinase/D-beta-D-heptose 1-phosphate adenosyltransferase|nr:adenylyltransferase/cytidyltransferase family protein [Puniceicoccales bacterium]